MQSFTLANLRRATATNPWNPAPWDTLIRAAPSGFKAFSGISSANAAHLPLGAGHSAASGAFMATPFFDGTVTSEVVEGTTLAELGGVST